MNTITNNILSQVPQRFTVEILDGPMGYIWNSTYFTSKSRSLLHNKEAR
jgi:hypothetical protein